MRESEPDAPRDEGARLVHAVRTADLATIQAVLDRHPDLINSEAKPLLHLAVAENHETVIRLLIDRGAPLNLRNADGRLPLHDCFELGRDPLAQLLLAAGAEPDVCAAAAYVLHDPPRNPESRPRSGQRPPDRPLALGWSVYGQNPESARILFEHGAIIDRPPYDRSAWGPASHVANLDVTRVFLANGANPNCRIQSGDTPLHAAIKSRLVVDPAPFVELLLASGADRSIQNDARRTALDEALLQIGNVAETYFPPRPIASKNLDRVIHLLRR